MDQALKEKIKERLALKFTSSRTILGLFLILILTGLLIDNQIDQNSYINGFKWTGITFFASKAVEHFKK